MTVSVGIQSQQAAAAAAAGHYSLFTAVPVFVS